jgi:hypothetical protein
VVNYAFRRIGARTPEQFAQMVIAGNPVVAPNSGDPVSWPYQWADQTLVVAKLAYTDVVPGPMGQQTSKSTGEAVQRLAAGDSGQLSGAIVGCGERAADPRRLPSGRRAEGHLAVTIFPSRD